MALIGNYSVLNKSCGRFRSGSTVSDNRSNYNRNSDNRAFYSGYATVANQTVKSSKPNGYLPSYGWVLPIRGGGLSSSISASSQITVISIAAGWNIDATINGSSAISDAPLQLIVSAQATINGTGSITDANILAALSAEATINGSGTFSTANINAIGHAEASISGVGSMTNTVIAIGILQATIQIGLPPNSTLDEIIEGDLTLRHAVQGMVSVLYGKNNTAAGVTTFRDSTDTVDRLEVTVSGGERTAVTANYS